MDDLSRIERTYGSVAEYNRLMHEEELGSGEITKEEQIKLNNMLAVYNEKIKLLDGKPSTHAQVLKEYWDMKAPKESDFESRNAYINAGYEYSRDRTLDLVEWICDHHSVSSDEEWATFYRPGLNKFGISVEYHNHGEIHSKHIGGLTYGLFKVLFCDLYFAGLHPTMSYEYSKDNAPLIISNCSLGKIRLSYLINYGVETDNSINKELKLLGFREDDVIKNNKDKSDIPDYVISNKKR